MPLTETALSGGIGALAAIVVTKVVNKVTKKDCTDCTLTGVVGSLKRGQALLIKYSQIPDSEKDEILKELVS